MVSDSPTEETEDVLELPEQDSGEGPSSEGRYEHAPDGSIRWPAPDRDSPQLGTFEGRYFPEEKIGALLHMEGHHGRSEDDIESVTGVAIKRPRRWHKIFERMGVFYPGDGPTRLARLGRMLLDASQPDGLKRLVAREVLEVLRRYQFDNPIERSLPEGCGVHPYWAVLRAASRLGWKIHWDEVNRELMRITNDDEIDEIVTRIVAARAEPDYDDFIGNFSNEKGLLRARTHPAETTAPEGKTPEGQLRDQRMTPFLKRAGFSELLLSSPGSGGGGYWSVPEAFRDLVLAAVETPPLVKRLTTEQEWIEWFCEGDTSASPVTVPPPPPLTVLEQISAITLSSMRAALAIYESELVFSDDLLASLVAALRSGDGKNFIILRGVSGTGKSRLVSAIAKAVYGTSVVDPPYMSMVEVRPDWTDGSYLLGHYDPVGGKYVRTRFLDALLAADEACLASPSDPIPVFICLDEMNLARVEYYLAECLSAMESGSPIHLDTRNDSSLPNSIAWRPNLFLFGTVNIDETTLTISEKVLDRAQVIDTSDIDLLPVMKKWLAQANHLDTEDRAKIEKLVGGTWSILRAVDSHFGYRTAKAIIRFVDEAKASSGRMLSIDDAIDLQLVQKVLVKLRGEGERWAQPLEMIERKLSGMIGKRRAHSGIARMKEDLERLGSFQFWN